MKLTDNKKKGITIAAHVLVWSLLVAFPLLDSTNEEMDFGRYFLRTWLPIGCLAIIFYANYFWLVDKFLFKDKLLLFIAVNVVLALALFYLNDLIFEIFRSHHRMRPPDGLPRLRRTKFPGRSLFKYRSFISLLLTAGTNVAIRVTQKWLEVETDKKNLEHENLKSELAHLHYQIQPHFFFNSLNNIYSLVDSSPTKAKETIHGLGKLMRHVLYEAKDEKIVLSQELTFLKNFIKLMEIRLSSNVTVTTSFPTTYPLQEMAPLLLVPLVENAFKHGVSASEPTTIRISLEINDGKLYFSTENSVVTKQKDDQSESGIGLPNLKKRLELLYPNRYEFSNGIKGNLYITKLTLQL